MSTFEELRKKRFQFLNLLYEKTGGDKYKQVNRYDLGYEIGLQRQEVNLIFQYLEGERLIKHENLDGGISITHYGVREVEEARSNPDQPTHYFPPVNIIQINHMEGSQIQQGTISSLQTDQFDLSKSSELIEFTEILKSRLSQLDLNPDDQSEVMGDVRTIETQIESKRPKISIISDCLSSIRRILEGAAGSVVATELIKYISGLLIGG